MYHDDSWCMKRIETDAFFWRRGEQELQFGRSDNLNVGAYHCLFYTDAPKISAIFNLNT